MRVACVMDVSCTSHGNASQVAETPDHQFLPLETVALPPRWTMPCLASLVTHGSWRGLESASGNTLAEELHDLRRRCDLVLAAVPRNVLVPWLTQVILSEAPAARARAASVIGCLGLVECSSYLREAIDACRPGECCETYLQSWISLQEEISGEVVTYLAAKTRHPSLRKVAMMALATSNEREAVEPLFELLRGLEHAVDFDLVRLVLRFLETFLSKDNWPLRDRQRRELVRELAPRLITALNLVYPCLIGQERLDLYDLGKTLVELLPESEPVPAFLRDRMVVEQTARFTVIFPDLATDALTGNDLILEFRACLVMTDLAGAIRRAGLQHARELAVLFLEGLGLLVPAPGGRFTIVLPRNLSATDFEYALWHAWHQLLAYRGLLSDSPEMGVLVVKVGHIDKKCLWLKYRFLSQVIIKFWSEETWRALSRVRRPAEIIPIMLGELERFPRKHVWIKWLLGERFFRELHGFFMFQLIYEVVYTFPERNSLTQRLAKELVRNLNVGQPPLAAYAALFETPFMQEHLARRDVFTSERARREAEAEE
ncbi:MAG: hypothetical protein HY814_08110 [Candidatus Riflebacteria bacterium]|nr:hypothetical protein [Candidatus Riflebacteria bacterium]